MLLLSSPDVLALFVLIFFLGGAGAFLLRLVVVVSDASEYPPDVADEVERGRFTCAAAPAAVADSDTSSNDDVLTGSREV